MPPVPGVVTSPTLSSLVPPAATFSLPAQDLAPFHPQSPSPPPAENELASGFGGEESPPLPSSSEPPPVTTMELDMLRPYTSHPLPASWSHMFEG